MMEGEHTDADVDESSIAELEAKIAAASDHADTDPDPIVPELRSLLNSLKEKHSSIRQIQDRVDGAQCDLLVMREEAQAAHDAALKSRSSVEGDVDAVEQKIAIHQGSIQEQQRKISQYATDNDALRKQIDAGSGWRPEQEGEKRSLVSSIAGARNNLHSAQSQLDAVRSQVLGMESSVRQAEASRDEAIEELQTVKEKVEALNREREIEQEKKTRLENSCIDLHSQKSQLENDMAEKSSCLQKEKEGLAVSERRLREDKATLEAQHRKRDALVREIKALSDKVQRQLEINAEVENTNAEKRLSVETRGKDLQYIDKDIVTMKRQRELVANKTTAAEEDRIRCEADVESVKLEGGKLETSLIAARKEDEAQRRQIEALERESTMLQRSLDLSQKDSLVYQDLIRTNEIALKNLESESNGIASALCTHGKMITSIDKEKQIYEDNVQSAQRQHAEAMDQLRQQEMHIGVLRKKAQNAETLLKKRQHAYEKVQIESHHQSTHLVEVQEELDRVRRRHHILDRHIGQVQDEIGRINEALATEHYQHFRADDESSKLRDDITILHQKIASTELHIRSNDLTMKNLNAAIDTKDDTITRLRKEHCAIMSERDVTCAHLVQKRDDLRSLKLKLQSQQSLMHHGEVMFQDQREQMDSLSEDRQGLQEEKEHLLSQAQEANVVIDQCTKLERELQRERAKKKVLQNDLGRPINIHRWRFLEVKDPERYSLLQQAHRLQRRILDVADGIAEKEALIHFKEAIYETAKSNVGRMPTVSSLQAQVLEQANVIKGKTGEIQNINAEVLLNRRRMAALKLELEVINENYRALGLNWGAGD
mmetsp:Transcript_18172/g.51997  ORF Transcript_18172/g.51997 Transcript_18172/m.51997 type:complete len:827 (-) Transcript_18172:1855-4335(-)